MRKFSVIALVFFALFALTAQAYAAPPKVVCVPAMALNPVVPHDTWSGLGITLKGTAHDPDGDGTLATYEWDFGDGSSVVTGAVTDPYVIEATHIYIGSVGDLFVATLTVTDLGTETGTDQYLVEIKDGSDITAKVNVAIDEGLWKLHKDQVRGTLPDGTPYGNWPYDSNSVAATGASTEAFEIQGTLPDGNADEDPYVETVQRGLNYLLSKMYSFPVVQDANCPQGDPDVNTNGIGLCCYTELWHSMYESGVVLMALSSSGCPNCIAATGISDVVGRTYLDIAQDMVDYFAYAQSAPGTGVFRGGWRYSANCGESDNSVSQWPVIGMESAEVNFGGGGLSVPQFVKDELNLWIDYIQNDSSGGSGYTAPWDWVNIAKTGGLLCEMKFFGDTTASIRAQNAVEYIYNNWDSDGEHFPTNSYYAFYSVMKGLRLLGIQTIHPINDSSGFDWYGDPVRGYAHHIVNDQASDGSWWGGHWSLHPLTSAWAILTLKKTVVQPGPVADAGPDVPSHPPLIEITFDGTSSYHRDPSRIIVQYMWDFGDGSPTVVGPIVTHAFPAVYNPDETIDWPATTADYTVTLTVTDDSDPALTDTDTCIVYVTPPPYPPVVNPNGPYTAYPCDIVPLDGSGSYDPNGELYPDPDHPWYGEIVSWEWDLDNDGEYDDATGETTTWSNCELGLYVVGLKVTNSFDESDEADTVINVVESTNELPVADPNGPYVNPLESCFDGTGSSDPDGDALTYSWDFGGGNSGTGETPCHTYAEAGIYDVCLTVNDGTVDSQEVCTSAVIYDPSAGFVTGGGWIDSPSGAYTPDNIDDEDFVGKANFGFVSKYLKKSPVPTGQTEFMFQAAGLNFHSDSYQWLLVNKAGDRAQYKGEGTINGLLDPNENFYKFMLWAVDSEPDAFRIKIWEEDEVTAEETVIYDNGFDQAIAGGSIVIHVTKK